MARPEKPIDWDRVAKLSMVGCTGKQIASVFCMHPDTFYDRFKEHYGVCFTFFSCSKKEEGDTLIMEAQFDKAVKDKDNTMLVWLGKTRLDQKEPESRSFVRVAEEFDKVLEIVKPTPQEKQKPEEMQ